MKKYQIIYADPPWQYTGNEVLARGSRLNKKEHDHYSTMTMDELKKLPIKELSEENSLLFMWVVSPSLDDGIDVMKSWGFEYATVAFVWHKKKTNPGYYTLSSCELCIVGKRGKIPTPRGTRNEHQFLSLGRGKHSEKPPEIRTRIAKMFPEQTKIELFARRPKERLFEDITFRGWDVWGNEIESDTNLTNNPYGQ